MKGMSFSRWRRKTKKKEEETLEIFGDGRSNAS